MEKNRGTDLLTSMNFRTFHIAALVIVCSTLPLKSRAQTTTTFDVLIATGNLTVSGTTTMTGEFSVGGSTFVVMNARVGIGTTSPLGILHIVQLDPSTGQKDELLMSRKNIGSSLLFGYRDADYWDYYNVGERSVSLGGGSNLIRGSNSGIIGGENNFNYTQDSFIGGGYSHIIDSVPYSAQGAAIVGGNNGLASGDAAFIAGGSYNSADRTGSAVIGGENNIAIGTGSVVLGGLDNLASGHYSGILGGIGNIASGNYSFAGGNFANASGRGSFVWADSQSTEFISSLNDEFKIRAQGGFVFYGTSTSPTVIVSSGAVMISTSATGASAVPNIFISSINGHVGIGKNSPATALDVNGAITAASATFNAAGNNIYSVTSSSGIHILSGGITWADGTTTISSAGASGGASFANEWQWAGDTVALNDVGVGFANLTSSVAYRVEIDINVSAPTGRVAVQFNGDTGNRYNYGYNGTNDQGNSTASGGVNQPDLTLCVDVQPPGGGFHGSVDFATVYKSSMTVLATARWSYVQTTTYSTGYSGGSYVGVAGLSSVKVIVGNSKTFSGVVKLFKRNGTAW